MKKDKFHLIVRATKIIRSCKTEMQCRTAAKYAQLAANIYMDSLPNRNLREAFENDNHYQTILNSLKLELKYQREKIVQ